MKNIPVFTASGGTATLILREIPRCGRAYVVLQTHTTGMEQEQIRDCTAFCRMAGAKEIYVSCADGTPLDLPFSHDMLLRTLPRTKLAKPECSIFLEPLSDPNIYVSNYNNRFAPVLNAALCDQRSLAQAATEGTKHFLARYNGTLIGLGAVRKNILECVASLEPGWGYDLCCALFAETDGDHIELTVCSENIPAMLLYDRLGFDRGSLISRWYKVT